MALRGTLPRNVVLGLDLMFRAASDEGPRRVLALLLLFTAGLLATSTASAGHPVKFLLSEAGVFSIDFHALETAGWPQGVPVDELMLTYRGRPVPVWVDSDDVSFGPGDRFLFVANPSEPSGRFRNDQRVEAAYFLRRSDDALPMGELDLAGDSVTVSRVCAPWYWRQHIEQDLLRAPLNAAQFERSDDQWFWAKLNQQQSLPFRVPVRLDASAPVRIEASLRGWSTGSNQADLPDHEVSLALNGRPLAQVQGDDDDRLILSTTAVQNWILPDQNDIELQVEPRRRLDGTALIDVVYLDWVAAVQAVQGNEWPRQALLMAGPELEAVRCLPDPSRHHVFVTDEPFDRANFRWKKWTGTADREPRAASDLRLMVIAGEADLKPPDSTQAMAVRTGTEDFSDVELLMVVPERWLDELSPLLAHRRQQGWSAEAVSWEWVVDRFNHGVDAPEALVNALQFMTDDQAAPISHLLLVGDADWNVRNRPRSEPILVSPVYHSSTGSGASDVLFVGEAGREALSAIAVGRVPARSPEDLRAVVEKLIRYDTEAPVGPWKISAFLAASPQARYQRRSSVIAEHATRLGLLVTPFDASDQSEGSFFDRFIAGHRLIHFYGHGGRHMWEIGSRSSPDRFFSSEEIEQETEQAIWPMVLSMTCSSGPFDHPLADSLAERLLLAPGTGAIAVLASGVRNSPPRLFTEGLLQALETETVGQALRRARSGLAAQDVVASYNLLGDPATRLVSTSHLLTLLLTEDGRLRMTFDAEHFEGSALIQWFDASSNERLTQETRLSGIESQISIPEGNWTQVSAYFWDEAQQVDAWTVRAFDGKELRTH